MQVLVCRKVFAVTMAYLLDKITSLMSCLHVALANIVFKSASVGLQSRNFPRAENT